jgi:hypothetical protein
LSFFAIFSIFEAEARPSALKNLKSHRTKIVSYVSNNFKDYSSCQFLSLKFSHKKCFSLIWDAFNLFYNKIWSTKLRIQHFLIGIFMWDSIRMSNFKLLSMQFCSWAPICFLKLKFAPFLVGICMEVTLSI